jgi:putative tricarboxylic transport membrane protein
VKLLKIPAPYLYAGVLTFAMLGAFAVAQNTFGMFIAIGVGIIGLLFRRYGYPITPLILGVVIGPMAELQLRRAVQISNGDFMTLIEKPFSVVIYLFLIVGLVVSKGWPLIKKRMASK